MTILQPTQDIPSGYQPKRRLTQELRKDEAYSPECVEKLFGK